MHHLQVCFKVFVFKILKIESEKRLKIVCLVKKVFDLFSENHLKVMIIIKVIIITLRIISLLFNVQPISR